MAERHRWLMAGPWRHPSGIYWFRKQTPRDLWGRRSHLAGLGIKITGEVQRSLGTRDKKSAERLYLDVAKEWAARWDNWRGLLEQGPLDLDHMNIIALAGQNAATYVNRHKRNPQLAWTPTEFIRGICENARLAYSRRSLRDGQAVFELGLELQAKHPFAELPAELDRLLNTEPPGPRRHLVESLAGLLASLRGLRGTGQAKALARDLGISLSPDSASALAKQAANYEGKAWETLGAYLRGDYRPPEWVNSLPEYDPPSPSPKAKKFTFATIIDAEAARRARGKDAKPFPESTIRKFKRDAEEFATFRKSHDASSVTAAEGKQWVEAMQDAGAISNRTVAQKLQNVRTVLNWGRAEDPASFHSSGNPLNGIRKPDWTNTPSDLRAFTMEEAKLVLGAARGQSKPMLRWIPWLCAYTGMRVSEAGALCKEDIFVSGNRHFIRVTAAGGRSLKNAGSERRIPVHNALRKEGFLKFVDKAPSGRLFRGETKEEINVQPRVGTWVRSLIPLESRRELSPNHGWRHLFEDMCREAEVQDEARNYMTGRTTGKSQELYGRSEVMLPGLAKMMDRIKPLLGG